MPPQYAALAIFMPGTVAISLTIYNKEKVKDLFKFSSLKNCLSGFIIPIVAILITYTFYLYYFSFWDEYFGSFTLKKIKDLVPGQEVNITTLLPTLLPITFVYLIFTSLGEEVGWRAYLLKKLKPTIPNFYARTIIVGIIWGIWHIPIYTANSSDMWKDGFTLPIICTYVIYTCVLSIIFAWLFEKDNSIWPVTFFHTTFNFQASIHMQFTTLFPVSTSEAVVSNILLAASYLIVWGSIVWFDRRRKIL
ncbi:MAG: CPBP family intramembrane metalloprotease [Wolbachia endosymbiont of Tyrophagus putrescentiae]|nr:CPBP family intramembrane metalloprotease [Wolbachia endosymbiont of Tyrophagus putrescentiae]